MAQVKIFAEKKFLQTRKNEISNIVHSCIVEALKIPPEKKFHRFFPLDQTDFLFPNDRSSSYIIIELIIFSGREKDTKKKMIKLIIEKMIKSLNLSPYDIEIVIVESARENWGIRGVPGDELKIDYPVDL